MLLEECNLKPHEVDGLDPMFVEVLLAKLQAKNDLAEKKRKQKGQ